MTEFFSRDPTKQLDEIKEQLYNRLKLINNELSEMNCSSYYHTEDDKPHEAIACLEDELEFLRGLIDTMERS